MTFSLYRDCISRPRYKPSQPRELQNDTNRHITITKCLVVIYALLLLQNLNRTRVLAVLRFRGVLISMIRAQLAADNYRKSLNTSWALNEAGFAIYLLIKVIHVILTRPSRDQFLVASSTLEMTNVGSTRELITTRKADGTTFGRIGQSVCLSLCVCLSCSCSNF